jgi:hypothetical protein
MLKSIQKYFKNRADATGRLAFQKGFGWAMAEVFLNGKDVEWVTFNNDGSPFDRGVTEALRRCGVLGDERIEYNELKPRYAALEQQNTELRNEVNWHVEQLTQSNGRIHDLNAANTELRATLTNLLAGIPDSWEPGDTAVKPLPLPKDLEGITLNSDWPELWVAQDENGSWFAYSADVIPSESIFPIQQWMYDHSKMGTESESLIQTNKNPNWKETKQRIR